METSRRVHRVSGRQVEMLWEFLNANRDIATAYNRSLQAKEYSQRKWREIADTLNSQGAGAHKDWKGWSKYWVDYKAKLKTKVAALRLSHVRTGGGPSTEKSLTEIEEKFLQILGNDFGQGLSGVRVEPFAVPPESAAVCMGVELQDSPASESILQPAHALEIPIIPSPIPTQSVEIEIIQDPLPANPSQEPIIHETPARSPIRTPSPHPATPSAARSPRRRRQRRQPHMSQEAARRALVRSSQMRAEAAVRTSEAMEQMVRHIADLQNTAMRIERVLHAAFPRAAEPENSA